MTTHSMPYVFVLDWDGTIAGKVDFQSQYYSVVTSLKKYGFKPRVQHAIPPAFAPSSKLIRPGFADWMNKMRKVFPDVYFFIYTASEKKWAHQEIAWVEKLHDIKFARPIFTRDDCTTDSHGNIRKALGRVFPRIIRTISKSRGQVLTPSQRKTILDNNIVIIDNNAVYTDRTDKLLLCPDYAYCVFENLLSVIPKDARKHPQVQQLIYGLINSGYMCSLPGETDDGMRALSKQYHWLATKCNSITSANEEYHVDDFWKHLKKLIVGNQLQTFSASIIKQLQEASWKHAKLIRQSSNNRPTSA
jgi:hypothetical protein